MIYVLRVALLDNATNLPFIQLLCILLKNVGHSQSLSSVAAVCLMTGVTHIVRCSEASNIC